MIQLENNIELLLTLPSDKEPLAACRDCLYGPSALSISRTTWQGASLDLSTLPLGLKPFDVPERTRCVLQEFHNITELRAMSQCEIPESRQPQASLSPYQHQAKSGSLFQRQCKE